jgi:hypothetical protein
VPEGYGLVLLEEGAITGFAAEPGAYEWNSEDAGLAVDLRRRRHRQPAHQDAGSASSSAAAGLQQRAYFVTLKELPNNRFGTQSEIYWDDAYMNAQVGAVTRGTYTLKIVDPILFVRRTGCRPAYLQPGKVFDFTDLDNDAASQLFNEVVGSLAPAFSPVHERSGQGQPDHQDPAGLDRLRQEPVGRGRAELPVEHRTRPGSSSRPRSSRSSTTRTPVSCSATCSAPMPCRARGATRTCRPPSPPGIEAAGENAGGGGPDRHGHGRRRHRPRRAAAAGTGHRRAEHTRRPAPVAAPAPAPVADDPVAKLAKFKEMLDGA